MQLVAHRIQNKLLRPRLWIDWGLKADGGIHNFLIEALAAKRSSEMVDLLVDDYGYGEEPHFGGSDPRFGSLSLCIQSSSTTCLSSPTRSAGTTRSTLPVAPS